MSEELLYEGVRDLEELEAFLHRDGMPAHAEKVTEAREKIVRALINEAYEELARTAEEMADE